FIVNDKPEGNLLDVGCSSGQFMHWARKRGMHCAGIEVNDRTANIAKQNGFEVHTGFLDEAPFRKNSFDVIYLGDVIEHVNEPKAFIKLASEFLKNDGLIVISTPNTDCFW